MSDNIIEKLKQGDVSGIDLENATQEQVEALVVYLAILARSTLTKHCPEYNKDFHDRQYNKFSTIKEQLPSALYSKVFDNIVNAKPGSRFWDVPSDFIIAAVGIENL